MKILIIDDSPDALAVAKARLANEGHEILCAGGGVEGLQTAAREKPDLILLDLDMPDLDGFEVCRRLKADADLCMIPVIFLSGSGGPEERVQGLDAGAVDFVTKPFDAFELRARVNAALRTKQMQDLLIQHAKIDPLTGLPNRRALDERLQQEWARLLRHGGNLSVIMADIDHFKNVNDRFGHPAGDEVLRHVARMLAAGCRESDVPARYGGEEFVVITPETSLSDAAKFADRLRVSICVQPLMVQGRALEITVSFGVADNEGLTSPEELVQMADDALYRAKSAGRNCVKTTEVQTSSAQGQPPAVPPQGSAPESLK
jgi:diguanylate cyclase (GGDEF)-like protein